MDAKVERTGKCPVMHGSLTSNSGEGTSNREWWPNQLNLRILHQNSALSDPMGEDPQLLLIKQYRYAADSFIYEVPAGRLEAGEDPIIGAQRELLEETGCTAGRLDPLTVIYTTPGFTDERIHLFMAHELTQGEVSRERDEFMEVQSFRLSEVLSLIKEGQITDGKTIVAVLYTAGFRLGR